MLVDPGTGELTSVSQQAIRAHRSVPGQVSVGVGRGGDEPGLEHELFLQQIETATPPVESLSDLLDEIRRGRAAVGKAAEAAGAAAVAMPTPVLVDPQEDVTPRPRYQRIYEEFGEISRQSLVCAMHVHIDIGDDAEAVAVIDRIRPWLPVLLAISANSPFWRGRDTGYASWRSQTWARWPSSGSSQPFGDAETYHATTQRMVDWGAALDPGMVYFDVRIAQDYPTVEVRVADVCTEVQDAGLVAALARGLVETGAESWHRKEPVSPWRSDLLRVASWRASRYGLASRLVHPVTLELADAREVVAALIEHTAEALDAAGDKTFVKEAFARLLSRGSGAGRQRAVREAKGDLMAVVKDLRERTEASWSP